MRNNKSHVELAADCAALQQCLRRGLPAPDPFAGRRHARQHRRPGQDEQEPDNAIFLSDDAKTVQHRDESMYTDPTASAPTSRARWRAAVFVYHDTFNPNKAEVEDLKERYRTGNVGDVEVTRSWPALSNFLLPARTPRMPAKHRPAILDGLIYNGTARREEGKQTLSAVKKAMGLSGAWKPISRAAEKRNQEARAVRLEIGNQRFGDWRLHAGLSQFPQS